MGDLMETQTLTVNGLLRGGGKSNSGNYKKRCSGNVAVVKHDSKPFNRPIKCNHLVDVMPIKLYHFMLGP